MLLPRPEYAVHKAWMYRLLIAIADQQLLSGSLRFKGGTCAAMRGFLDRFSVDLDFDLVLPENNKAVQKELEKIFKKAGLIIKDKSSALPQYFLKYPSQTDQRNTIKLEAVFPVPVNNAYEPVRFNDIDRILYCHTLETMFSNKLVSLLDRYDKHRSIAGRDLYDIHTFLIKGYSFNPDIITERRQTDLETFFSELIAFIEEKITQTIINQDLNYLLPNNAFQQIRKSLKQEVIMLLKDRVELI
ncbi:nucleotidyl transferase AbiEii/AbiGii toxin family protein [Candidatus Margulisiibacteriota bacterium]